MQLPKFSPRGVRAYPGVETVQSRYQACNFDVNILTFVNLGCAIFQSGPYPREFDTLPYA